MCEGSGVDRREKLREGVREGPDQAGIGVGVAGLCISAALGGGSHPPNLLLVLL